MLDREQTKARLSSKLRIPARASMPSRQRRSSSHSLPPRQAGLVWGCRLVGRSSKVMVGSLRPCYTLRKARSFNLHFRLRHRNPRIHVKQRWSVTLKVETLASGACDEPGAARKKLSAEVEVTTRCASGWLQASPGVGF